MVIGKNMVTFDPNVSTVTFKGLRLLKRTAARGMLLVPLLVERKGSSIAGCQQWGGPHSRHLPGKDLQEIPRFEVSSSASHCSNTDIKLQQAQDNYVIHNRAK